MPSLHLKQDTNLNEIITKMLDRKLITISETMGYTQRFNELFERLLHSTENEKAEIYFFLGYTCFMPGRYLFAADYFKRGLSYSPRLINFCLGLTYYNKGKLLEKSGNFTAAKRNYDLSTGYYETSILQKGEEPTAFIICNALGQVISELKDSGEKNLKDVV